MQPTRDVKTLVEDVAAGLFSAPRTLPPKYFYDDHGSQLFDQICDAPEYYPTRTEAALLQRVATEVMRATAPACIVELGSGTSRKTRYLLDSCRELGMEPSYAPVDVCDDVLRSSGSALQSEYPWLSVNPVVGDYTAGLGNLPRVAARNLFVFLGGTIGNFLAAEAQSFLVEVREQMTTDDCLLLGADRVKDPDMLHAAYNDDAGITAAFNLNVLHVLNRELGANFNLSNFEHYAHFNPVQSQIEMHLIAMRDQEVAFTGLDPVLRFQEGDSILTEVSRKFTRRQREGMLVAAGFTVEQHFEAENVKFSLVLARPTR